MLRLQQPRTCSSLWHRCTAGTAVATAAAAAHTILLNYAASAEHIAFYTWLSWPPWQGLDREASIFVMTATAMTGTV